MGAPGTEVVNLSRRGFLGWGATLLTAAVMPGATLLLTENTAAAADSPYTMTSWLALMQQWVQVATPGQVAVALQIVRVTPATVANRLAMTGDAFTVAFRASAALPAQIYTVTAPGLGSLPLFMSGSAGRASAIINRRLPAR